MEVSRIRALRGPNLWTRHTAVEAMVRCGDNENDLTKLAGFEARLRHLFPGIGHLRASERGAKVSMAHALEAATLHLQTEAGCPVTFSRSNPTPETDLFQVVVEYTEEQVGILALSLAEKLCQAALHDQAFDLESAVKQLHESLDRRQPGAIRLGQQATPHPGRRGRQQQRHRRIDRARQRTDQATFACRRCARPLGTPR